MNGPSNGCNETRHDHLRHVVDCGFVPVGVLVTKVTCYVIMNEGLPNRDAPRLNVSHLSLGYFLLHCSGFLTMDFRP